MRVLDLKRELRQPHIHGVNAVVSIPAGPGMTPQPVVVAVTKTAMKRAVAHLPSKTEIFVTVEGNQLTIGEIK